MYPIHELRKSGKLTSENVLASDHAFQSEYSGFFHFFDLDWPRFCLTGRGVFRRQ